MENRHIKVFWIGFVFTAALTAWIYWIWRRKRVVTPRPLVVTSRRQLQPEQTLNLPRESRPSALVSDPLEEIKGIGPVFANRLNEAGILTYRQLASTSPADLVRITGVTRWDPADWISEAADLAEGQ